MNLLNGSILKRMALMPLIICFLTSAYASEVTITHASWYAKYGDNCDPFPHITMANGEKFDENRLTCASWDYPFGTLLRITNRTNGKSVEVVVTDRGPSKRLYKKGRKIDLSKMAFSKLEKLSKGIVAVKVEIIK